MKKYVAVVGHENGKVTKYQDFDTSTEAQTHVSMYGGFSAHSLNAPVTLWVVDGENEEISLNENKEEDKGAIWEKEKNNLQEISLEERIRNLEDKINKIGEKHVANEKPAI